MSKGEAAPYRRYYFGLPRLWTFLNGGDANRGEQNWIEAYFAGAAVFLISYATCVAQLDVGALVAIALLFVTWLAWVALFYVNSLIVEVLRRAGLFAGCTNSRAQNVMIGIETTACAIALTVQPRWCVLGCGWLLVVAANSAAAVVLRLAKQRDA